MDGNVYGYARLYEKEDDKAAHCVLIGFGVARNNIYTDEQSYKNRDIPHTGDFWANSSQEIPLSSKTSSTLAGMQVRCSRSGNPPTTRPESFPFFCNDWAKNEISARRAAKELGVTHRTFLTWVNDGEQTAKDSR